MNMTFPHLRASTLHKEQHWCGVYAGLDSRSRAQVESTLREVYDADWQLLSALYAPQLDAHCDGGEPRERTQGPKSCDVTAPPPSLLLPSSTVGYCAANSAIDEPTCKEGFIPMNRCASRRPMTGPILVHVPKTGGTSVAEALLPPSTTRLGPPVCHTPLGMRIAGGVVGRDDFVVATVRNPYARAVAAHAYWWSNIGFVEYVRLLRVFHSGARDPMLDTPSRLAPEEGRRKMSLSRPQAHWLLPHAAAQAPSWPLRVWLLRTEHLDCDFAQARRVCRAGETGRAVEACTGMRDVKT